MLDLKIDEEFRNKIPPLTKEEFEQLRENILDAGEIYEPIVTWNGVIVDGHNRYRIYCENPTVKYRTREMDFPDKWAAFEWMYKNQLGRRNLTDEQRTYMIGKMYEARKNANAFKGNQYTESGCRQNGANQKGLRTKDIIAKEVGIGSKSVERAEKFAQGVDAIETESPEDAQKVLRGETGIAKSFIASIPTMPEKEQKQAIEAVRDGVSAVARFKKAATMEECNATPIVHEEAYNEKDFAAQVSTFPKEFDDLIRLFLLIHKDMLKREECANVFTKMLTDTEEIINNYRRLLNEYRNEADED